MKTKSRRKWAARIARPRIQARDVGPGPEPGTRAIAIDHPADFYEERQIDSTHVLICPKCGARRYVDHRFVESIEEIKRVAKGTEIQVVGARHKECETVLEIEEL